MSIKKCMTCGCDDMGNDHHYISDTEKCTSCIDKGQGPCWDGYEYAGTKNKDGREVPNCIPVKKGEKCPSCMEKGQGPCWDGYQYAGTKEKDGRTVPNCIPVKKADGYQPNAGMKAAARRALKWRDAGMATGAGTPVGWGRASDIVAGRSMSLDTVKRMYSFFSRHEVDKKGKDWDKPSNGKIMWNAWGGDAGYAWSRAIVQKEDKIEKESGGAGMLGGGNGFKLEYNVPDCLGGYAITKAGTGQVIGCYTTKEHAQAAMDAIAVNQPNITKGDQSKQNQQEGIGSFNFWNGSLAPVMGSQYLDARYNSTYNSPPQKDGQPSVGYGNRSDKNGRSNS